MIPLIAMQYTSEVSWTVVDFVLAGFILYIFLIGLYYLWSTIKSSSYRMIACILVLLLFLLVWIELAVGIFDSPFAGS